MKQLNLRTLTIALLTLAVSFAGSLAGARTLSCESLFKSGGVEYRAHNPTAALNAADYTSINNRTMAQYSSSLLGGKSNYAKLVRKGDFVLDLGGGRGQAMWDLANQVEIEAVVINTQDYSTEFHRQPAKGRLSYRTGWVEEVLPSVPSNSAAVVFDMFGAFTYSPRKDLIVQEALRVLKPGGSAFLLFDFTVTPAFVQTSHGLQRFDEYLVERWPANFKSRSVFESGRAMRVIEIRKPKSFLRWLSPATELLLPLEVVKIETATRGRATVPHVLFREP